jgi:Flp pilus assembly protein TadD
MVKNFGSALTALGLIGALSACAQPGAGHFNSAAAVSKDTSKIGLAIRAQDALVKGDAASAVTFAEQAVAATPNDADFRALLGNAYFAAGRFASAEAAYKDSLSLNGGQAQIVLKLALVTIAQGKASEAAALLDSARNSLDPSDYGLALALAGQPSLAANVLEEAARAPGADARVRQNLALAYALQGEWTEAKTIAGQDMPADQLDARIQQWMAFAKPAHAADQVAALTGVTPAAADPGQPVRLALNAQPSDVRLAAAEPVPAPAPAFEAAPPMAQQAAAPAAVPPAVEYAAAPVETAPEPIAVAAADPAPVVPPPVAKAAKAKAAPAIAEAKPGLSPRASSLFRKASLAKPARGNSNAVVQLGAYSSSNFVHVAWNNISKKYPALRGYDPSTARFESAKGTVYRLSVKGFASDAQARDFCSSLKSAGGSCFVRDTAGDAPVRLASL